MAEREALVGWASAQLLHAAGCEAQHLADGAGNGASAAGVACGEGEAASAASAAMPLAAVGLLSAALLLRGDAAAAAAVEALKALLGAMKAHRALEDVQQEGCCALAAYAGTGVDAAKEVARAGGVKTLLFAMRTHIRSGEVQAPGVRALRRVAAASQGCRGVLVAANGVAMLASVMKRHDADPAIQSDGGACLAALALGGPDGMRALAKDGPEALVGALRCSGLAADAADPCREALRSLVAAEPSLRVRIERANGAKYL